MIRVQVLFAYFCFLLSLSSFQFLSLHWFIFLLNSPSEWMVDRAVGRSVTLDAEIRRSRERTDGEETSHLFFCLCALSSRGLSSDSYVRYSSQRSFACFSQSWTADRLCCRFVMALMLSRYIWEYRLKTKIPSHYIFQTELQ